MSEWTRSDADRLLKEALDAGDKELVGRVLWSDNFEPSLLTKGGLRSLLVVTPEEKRAEKIRVDGIRAEWAAIRARWQKEDAH